MRKTNILILILSLTVLLFGCNEEQAETPVDPNVINRGESQYNITAELTADDTAKKRYQFGAAINGRQLEDEETYHIKWNFGDTQSAEGLSPVHEYSEDGVYSVTAYITDNKTDTFRTAMIDITAGIDPDIYDTNILAYRGEDRREFKLIASAVSASGESLKYSWNFSDGSPVTLAKRENSVEHMFAKYGETYNVVVTIDNGKGGEGSKVEVAIPVVTDLPDLSWQCGSGGPALDNNNYLIGQYLNCEPKLTGGIIPDVVYNWEYYSEIKQEAYQKDNASMIVTLNGKEVTYDEAQKDTYKYYALEGVGTSNVNEATQFMYKDGGNKFIKLAGSSQNFLKTNMEYASELTLPSNAYLDLITCQVDETTDKSGLTYKCSAKGYAQPKDDAGNSYIVPLSLYNWSVYDHNGNLLVENITGAVTTCYPKAGDGSSTGTQSGTVINGTETQEELKNANYEYCESTVTYKAAKYDVSPAYSTMVLDTDYYETIEGHETEHIKLQQTRDFRVEAPKIKSVTHTQDTSNKLMFNFTVELDKTLDTSTVNDIKYHWNFGDGSDEVVTDTNTTSHTYQNADSQYTITVYASSSLFSRTEEGTTKIQMSPSFSGSKFTVNIINGGNNIIQFESDYKALVDTQEVDTEYEITISGGEFTKTYKVPADNFTAQGFSVVSVSPTVENLQDNSILSVPYGMPFTAELKVMSSKSAQVYYATTTIPLSTLSTVTYTHPSSLNSGSQIKLSTLKSSNNVDVNGFNKFTCTYDAHYLDINLELKGKLGFSTNSNFTQSELQSVISVPCNTAVHVKRFDGANNKVSVSARITGPYYGLPVNRYLGVYPPQGNSN